MLPRWSEPSMHIRTIPIMFLVTLVIGVTSTLGRPQNAPNDPVATWKLGEIRNRRFENTFLGIVFTPPPDVTLEMGDGTPLSQLNRAFGLFHAVRSGVPGKPNSVIMATANSLLSSPESERTSEHALATFVQRQREAGYEVVVENKKVQWGNGTFLEADLGKGVVNQCVRVTWRRGYALIFAFGSDDAATEAHLVSASQISLVD